MSFVESSISIDIFNTNISYVKSHNTKFFDGEQQNFRISYFLYFDIVLEKTTFIDGVYLDSTFIRSKLNNNKFKNVDFEGVSLIKVEFEDSLLLGNKFSKSNFNEVSFAGGYFHEV